MAGATHGAARRIAAPQSSPGQMLRLIWPFLFIAAVAVYGWFGSQPLTIMMIFAALWATSAIGYDVFSGYSGRINMGYAMFPGTSAYVAGVLGAKFGVSVWLCIAAGVGAALLLALLLGLAALRIKGVYFALSTAIVPLVLYQSAFVFDRFLGGEEGIWGVPPAFMSPKLDLLAALAILALSLAASLWFVNSKAGIVLRAIKGGDLTAQAMGIDVFRFLLVGFLLSAAIGGLGGAYLAHAQMFIGPEILFIVTTLQIITFAQVGGPGTIVGPMLGSFLLVALNEYLREISDLRLLIYFTALVLLLRFAPDGVIVPAGRAARRLLPGGRRDA